MKKLLNQQKEIEDCKGITMNKVYNSIIKGLEEAIKDAQLSEKKLKYIKVECVD